MALRRHKRRRRWLKWMGWISLVILILAGVGYVVLYSSILRVDDVRIVDSEVLYDHTFLITELERQAIRNHPMLSLITPDNLLFWLVEEDDTSLVHPNITPSLASVTISTNVSQRTVDITLEQKSLSAIACEADARCYAVDEEGIVFAEAPHTRGSLITKVRDTNERPFVLGEPFLSKEVWIQHIFETVQVIQDVGLHVTDIAIRDLALREWQATLSGGVTLYFDLTFVPEDLAAVLETMEERVDLDQLKYFDFRVPNRLYYQ